MERTIALVRVRGGRNIMAFSLSTLRINRYVVQAIVKALVADYYNPMEIKNDEKFEPICE